MLINGIIHSTYARIESLLRKALGVSIREARRLMRAVRYGSAPAIAIAPWRHVSVSYWGCWVVC
jgi:hypothetical protein